MLSTRCTVALAAPALPVQAAVVVGAAPLSVTEPPTFAVLTSSATLVASPLTSSAAWATKPCDGRLE